MASPGRRGGRRLAMLVTFVGPLALSAAVRAGPYAGGAPEIKLGFTLTAGPTLAGGISVAEGQTQGVVAGGVSGSLVASRWSKLSVAGALDGGVKSPDTCGFVHLNISAGSWIFTTGPSVVVAFDRENAGLALGPEVTVHLNLGRKRGGHELQLSARGDFFVAGNERFSHAFVAVVRFVLNVLR